MGLFSFLKGAAIEANDDAHGARLLLEVNGIFIDMEQLEPTLQFVAMDGYLQVQRKIRSNLDSWSKAEKVQVGRLMQSQAREQFKFDMAGGYAKWLGGAWLEGLARDSLKAKQAFGLLEAFAEYCCSPDMLRKQATDASNRLDRAMLDVELDEANSTAKSSPERTAVGGQSELENIKKAEIGVLSKQAANGNRRAIDLLVQRAESGEAHAQFCLGLILSSKESYEDRLNETISAHDRIWGHLPSAALFNLAAKKGHSAAQQYAAVRNEAIRRRQWEESMNRRGQSRDFGAVFLKNVIHAAEVGSLDLAKDCVVSFYDTVAQIGQAEGVKREWITKWAVDGHDTAMQGPYQKIKFREEFIPLNDWLEEVGWVFP